MMPDGKALQSGTSHDLGQHFSQESAFNISFQDQNGQTQYVWQTSFGLSTRIIGALIMTHGDDDGLVLPPKIAPYQVVIVTAQQDQNLADRAEEITQGLRNQQVRVRIDHSDHGLGWKLNDAELKGSPVIITLGNKELETGELTLKIRHSGEKQTAALDELSKQIPEILDAIQLEMFVKAQERTKSLTFEAKTYDQFKQIMKTSRGFIEAFWCEDAECEKAIKDETKATTRCLPFIDDDGNVAEENGTCVRCGNAATHKWLFAQAY